MSGNVYLTLTFHKSVKTIHCHYTKLITLIEINPSEERITLVKF